MTHKHTYTHTAGVQIREKYRLKRGKLTIQEIAEDFDVSEDFILQIKKEHKL